MLDAVNELKPCPFCGNDATVERIGRNGYFYVACNTPYCCDFGKADTEAEAIAAWNTRAERTCKWEYPKGVNGWTGYIVCSNCGARYGEDMTAIAEYCPNCGVRVIG